MDLFSLSACLICVQRVLYTKYAVKCFWNTDTKLLRLRVMIGNTVVTFNNATFVLEIGWAETKVWTVATFTMGSYWAGVAGTKVNFWKFETNRRITTRNIYDQHKICDGRNNVNNSVCSIVTNTQVLDIGCRTNKLLASACILYRRS